MGYQFSKYSAPLECFAVWRGGFNEDEIEKIVFLEELQSFDKGKIGTDPNSQPDLTTRDSEVAWIHPDQNSDWLFNRLSGITSKVNYDHFLYDIDGIDALQYTKYGLNQHYTWHWDVSFGWENYQRKMSFVVMLSDPEEYEGGEFQICNNGNLDSIVSLKPNKGDIVYFASWMPHRVAPVTSGQRRSLVGWVMGKRAC